MKTVATILMFFALVGFVRAQENAHTSHWLRNAATERTTIADTAENQYDVKYVKLDLNMTNTTTTVSGCATTKAVVTAPYMSKYVFELIVALHVDSVLVDGVACSMTSSGDVRTATLPVLELIQGSVFTAKVYYHGTPPSGSLYSAKGINALQSTSWGAHAVFTLSESYHAKEWWPCKQSLQDKIDSSDVWVTIGDTLKAGSNGILNAITTIDSNHVRYEWKERNPIDYYLVSVAISTYTDYSYYMHYTGSTDSTLVQNYIYNNPATLANFQSVIDSTGMMIDYFSTIYGRYPFWKEKYGHCMAPLGGGMEHETIFMNEGLASYSEDLFYDHFNSHTGMLSDIRNKQLDVLSYDTGTIFCPDTTSEARIFDSRLSYDKGACVLHTLRFVVNNDSLFFAAYRLYQQNLADSTGTIDDFKNSFEAILGTTVNGINLDTFFNQWWYQQGFPIYNIRWNQVGTHAIVKLIQTTTVPSSVPLFQLPIDLVFATAAGDTLVRVLNNADTQIYYITIPDTIINFYFDPNYWLIYRQYGPIVHDGTLINTGIAATSSNRPLVYPNPAPDAWLVTGLTEGAVLQIYDCAGREIWSGTNGTSEYIRIPAANLAAGMYLLRVAQEGREPLFEKLMKE